MTRKNNFKYTEHLLTKFKDGFFVVFVDTSYAR